MVPLWRELCGAFIPWASGRLALLTRLAAAILPDFLPVPSVDLILRKMHLLLESTSVPVPDTGYREDL